MNKYIHFFLTACKCTNCKSATMILSPPPITCFHQTFISIQQHSITATATTIFPRLLSQNISLHVSVYSARATAVRTFRLSINTQSSLIHQPELPFSHHPSTTASGLNGKFILQLLLGADALWSQNPPVGSYHWLQDTQYLLDLFVLIKIKATGNKQNHGSGALLSPTTHEVYLIFYTLDRHFKTCRLNPTSPSGFINSTILGLQPLAIK